MNAVKCQSFRTKVWPNLETNCLQSLSTDEKLRHKKVKSVTN